MASSKSAVRPRDGKAGGKGRMKNKRSSSKSKNPFHERAEKASYHQKYRQEEEDEDEDNVFYLVMGISFGILLTLLVVIGFLYRQLREAYAELKA